MMQRHKEAIEPWKDRWLEGRTGWDQGRAHDQMNRLLQHAVLEGRLPAGAKIFSAGCGRAHNEAWLAGQGFRLLAIDAVEEAIVEARKLYGTQPGLTLTVADVFAEEGDGQLYDALFDRAMICAINPALRSEYLHIMSRKLRPHGLILAILFRRTRSPEGPPFAIDEDEARQLFAANFDLCYASSCPPPPNPQNVLEEWLCIWRKRSV